MAPPSSLRERLKAATTESEYRSGNEHATTYCRPSSSSFNRTTPTNTNGNDNSMIKSRPGSTNTTARPSSLAAAAATGSATSAPSSLGQRIGRYILNVGDDKCDNGFDGVKADGIGIDKKSSSSTTTTTCKPPPVAHTVNDDALSTPHVSIHTKADTTTNDKEKISLTTLQHLSARQQHLHDHVFNSLPPYHMCSQSEACDRAQYSELSPFEYSHTHLIALRLQQQNQRRKQEVPFQRRCSRDGNRPTFNPHHVVKKYRRSAAGGGTLSDNTHDDAGDGYRSMDMLNTTVDYLLKYIFVHQRPPPPPDTPTHMDNSTNNDAGDPNEISIWGDDDDENVIYDNSHHQQQKDEPLFSLAETVSFIDDRLRAVQKDLVSLLGNQMHDATNQYHQQQILFETKRTARKMQAAMVRYYILASYLLSDLPLEKYEKTFGVRALRTAMASYRELSSNLHEDYNPHGVQEYLNENNSIEQRRWRLRRERQLKELSASYKSEVRTRDEIMAYAAILHSSAMLYSEESALYASSPDGSGDGGGNAMSSIMEDGGSGWGALLLMMSSSSPTTQRCHSTGGPIVENNETEEYPRWKWAVKLASAALNGNYQRYFALLESGPVALDISTTAIDHDDKSQTDHARFLILARCCASHSLNLVRLGQLRRYNHAFGKGEAVPVMDIAMLLRLGIGIPSTARLVDADSSKWAIDFCRDAGLPVIEKKVGERESLYVLMKSAPICVKGDGISRMCSPGRMNDIFVFGSKLDHICRKYGGDIIVMPPQSTGIQEDDVDNWEDRDRGEDDNDEEKQPVASATMSTRVGEARHDEDGVLIPSRHILRSLIE